MSALPFCSTTRPARRKTRRQCAAVLSRSVKLMCMAVLWLVGTATAAAQGEPAPDAARATGDDAAARRVIAREELGIDSRVGYSGDRVIQSSQAGRTLNLREFRMPGKARLEFEEQGQQIVMILDEAAGTAFMLIPALRMYSTVSVREYQTRAWDSLDLLDFERLDRERINGHETTRYRVSYRDADGNQGHGFHWVTDDGVAIRMDITYDSADRSGERIVLDLQNLVVGPQAPTLFDLPDGYLALPSLEGLLGNGAGGAEGSGGAIDLETLREGLGELLNDSNGQ